MQMGLGSNPGPYPSSWTGPNSKIHHNPFIWENIALHQHVWVGLLLKPTIHHHGQAQGTHLHYRLGPGLQLKNPYPLPSWASPKPVSIINLSPVLQLKPKSNAIVGKPKPPNSITACLTSSTFSSFWIHRKRQRSFDDLATGAADIGVDGLLEGTVGIVEHDGDVDGGQL